MVHGGHGEPLLQIGHLDAKDLGRRRERAVVEVTADDLADAMVVQHQQSTRGGTRSSALSTPSFRSREASHGRSEKRMVGFEMRHVHGCVRDEPPTVSQEERLHPLQPKPCSNAGVAHQGRACVTRDDVRALAVELGDGGAKRRAPLVRTVVPDKTLDDATEPDTAARDDGQYHDADQAAVRPHVESRDLAEGTPEVVIQQRGGALREYEPGRRGDDRRHLVAECAHRLPGGARIPGSVWIAPATAA